MTGVDLTDFTEYLSLDAAALRERYLRVMARLADLHHELAMIQGQERRAKTQIWIDNVQRGKSQREADKYADHAAIEFTCEYWEVKAEIEAGNCEKTALEVLLQCP